ncbi:nucleotidyltransferase family protein [Formosa sp. S-31]|uniref:nucleotidyltransferase family protein n=1 Tax=Formosa sp. S-31 TaxID=2790949 RepID=UPI003EBBA0DF
MQTVLIVLAAGASTRMKRIKQLLPYNKVTLLEHTLNTALNTNATAVICVLGANSNLIQREVNFKTILVTTNQNWADGLGSSIAHGIQFAQQQFSNLESVLFTLADQPFVSSNHLNSIITSATNPENIYATKYEDTFGVPTLFPKFYFNDLRRLKGDQGAKVILKQNQNKIAPITPDFTNTDIDTPEDYRHLK